MAELIPWPSELAARFWRLVYRADGCWLWRGTIHRQYGVLTVNNRQVRAHRLAYELTYGSIPAGRVVRHRCDVRACVRPDHLLLGTPADNVQDRVTRGRSARGERVGSAKLTAATVAAIRESYARGEAGRSRLARRFGVSRPAIAAVLRGDVWPDAEWEARRGAPPSDPHQVLPRRAN